jgi:hypothetical protein
MSYELLAFSLIPVPRTWILFFYASSEALNLKWFRAKRASSHAGGVTVLKSALGGRSSSPLQRALP